MSLYTQNQYELLVKNGLPENTDQDHAPIVKWFTPDANTTWLVSEIVDEETAFGLCDMGHGFPELGYISMPDITGYISPNGHKIERDIHFEGKFPMSVYHQAARSIQMITENNDLLKQAEQCLNEKKLSL
ncbi:MAG: hypothetical protein RL204_46 [Bacteroidota bacterium]|jgi:hypothetical protein